LLRDSGGAMVDVTVDNFQSVLDRLRVIVPTADFVSLDLEFTGLDHDSYGEAALPAGGSGAAGGCAAAGSAGSGSAAPSSGRSAESFDLEAEAQTKYAKLCEASSFLVVQARTNLVCPLSSRTPAPPIPTPKPAAHRGCAAVCAGGRVSRLQCRVGRWSCFAAVLPVGFFC